MRNNTEILINRLSQIVYLNIPEKYLPRLPIKIGELADYYLYTIKGRKFLKDRFGNIPQEFEKWKQLLYDTKKYYYNIRIVNVFDDNRMYQSGLYACTFYTEDNKCVIAFRGSEMLGNNEHRNDYETDFALAYMLETPQHLKALQFIKQYEYQFNDNIYITGHSLGGNLALFTTLAAESIRDQIVACYSFNAPGFNDDFLITYTERIQGVSKKIYNIQNEYDVVSSIFNSIGKPIIIESDYKPSDKKFDSTMNVLYPHSNFCFKTLNGEMVRSKKQKKSAYCNDINNLTKSFLQFSVSARKDICNIILDILYDDQKDEFILSRIFDAIITYCKDKKNGVILGAQGELIKVLETAKESCENCTVNEALDQYRSSMDLPVAKTSNYVARALTLRNWFEIIKLCK